MTSLTDSTHRLLLRAATRKDAAGFEAFQQWRARVPMKDIAGAAYRIMPLLVDAAGASAADDPDLARMKGIGRHVWVRNMMRLKQLFGLLDAMAERGIEPPLLKGAALFARAPELAGKRVAGDYDLLLPEGSFTVAASVAREQGFAPQHCDWSAVEEDLIGGITSGVNRARDGGSSDIDLHWRALQGLDDLELTKGLFARAERRALQGRDVLIPDATDHLFLTVARCEPNAPEEAFTRLLEGHMLIEAAGDAIDWRRLVEMVGRYRLGAVASAFFRLLEAETPTRVSREFSEQLSKLVGPFDRLEFKLREQRRNERPLLSRWFLGHRDQRFHRVPRGTSPTLAETVAQMGDVAAPARLRLLWRAALQRGTRQASSRTLSFLSGWHYAETEGRWSDGRVAVLSVHADGRPVRLSGYLMDPGPGGPRPTLMATNGRDTVRIKPAGEFTLELPAAPQARLNGHSLLVLWTSSAVSPHQLSGSDDHRMLGVFLRGVEAVN